VAQQNPEGRRRNQAATCDAVRVVERSVCRHEATRGLADDVEPRVGLIDHERQASLGRYVDTWLPYDPADIAAA
jgi:hypothetical protein